MGKLPEWAHILGSMILLAIAVGAVFARGGWLANPFSFSNFEALVYPTTVAFFALGISFVAHELAHRWVAVIHGGKAVYRASWASLAFTIILASYFGILFAAPGGVFVDGIRNKNIIGRVALAGPLANLILLPAFLPISTIGGFLGDVGFYGVLINAALALFNMIPIGGLDGNKVWQWNKGIWAIVFVTSLLALGFVLRWLTWV